MVIDLRRLMSTLITLELLKVLQMIAKEVPADPPDGCVSVLLWGIRKRILVELVLR